MVLAKYGENTELDEDASGNTVIRNTATGTEVLLADFVDIVGSFGSAANRIDGESFFDQLNANSVETSTVIDSDDATSYDVGDDLASGAFSDGDNDGTYTLPNPDDGIDVGSVNAEVLYTGGHSDRPVVGSDEFTQIYVDPDSGDDSATGESGDPIKTIQEAMRRTPLTALQNLRLELAGGSYDEHVVVPATVVSASQTQATDPTNGIIHGITFNGDESTPSNVKIKSIAATTPAGALGLEIRGVQIQEDSPVEGGSDDAGISIYGPGYAKVSDAEFASAVTDGILAYRSRVDIRNVDFSNCTNGAVSKMGFARLRNCSGTTTEEPVLATEAGIAHIRSNNSFSGSATTVNSDTRARANLGAFVYDEENDHVYSDDFGHAHGTVQLDGTDEQIIELKDSRATGLLLVTYRDDTDADNHHVDLVLYAGVTNTTVVASEDRSMGITPSYGFDSQNSILTANASYGNSSARYHARFLGDSTRT